MTDQHNASTVPAQGRRFRAYSTKHLDDLVARAGLEPVRGRRTKWPCGTDAAEPSTSDTTAPVGLAWVLGITQWGTWQAQATLGCT